MKKRIKYITLLLTLAVASTTIYGCNNNDPAAEETPAEAPENNDASTPTPDAAAPADNTSEIPPASAPAQTPIGDRSPVAVTRIEPDPVVYDNPQVSGAYDDPITEPAETDPHEHEPIPNLFPIDRCLIEVNGEYDSEFARNMVTAINAARVDYLIPEVTRNTGLLACADIRCKEQAYFIGHFRPDGRSWRSVAPGYVQGECIAVDYRTAEDVVRAWLNVNDTRVQLMNPDYTQVGTSVYNIDGTLYVAVEFGY